MRGAEHRVTVIANVHPIRRAYRLRTLRPSRAAETFLDGFA